MLEDWVKRSKKIITSAKDHAKEYKGIKGKAQKILDWSAANMLGAQRFFDRLDGGKQYQGVWNKFMSDQVNAAYDAELMQKTRRRLLMEAKMRELGIKTSGLKASRTIDINGGMDLTVDALIHIYAGMQNNKSRAAILNGNFYFAQDLQQANEYASKCIAALSENEKALGDYVIQEFEENFDRINDALIDVYNRGMEHEENYTPMIRTQVEGSRDGVFDPDTAENLLKPQHSEGFKGIEKGFTKSRINIKPEHQQGIQLGLISTWHTQMEVQEHAAAFGAIIRDMRSVLFARNPNGGPTVYQMLKATRGTPAAKMIKQYFNIAATSNTLKAFDALDGVSKILARNMSIGYLCGNLGTAAKQFPSFFRVLPYAGAESTLNAVYDFIQHPVEFLNECYKLDPQLKARSRSAFIQELLRAGDSQIGTVYNQALEYASAPINFMDKMASCIVFKAVYDANIKKGVSHDEAVRQGQRVVLLTQPAIHTKDKPLLWHQSGYAKLAMMFTTDLAQTFGETVYDLTQDIKHGRVKESFYRIVGLTIAAGFIKGLTSGLPDEDTPEEWAKWLASAFTKQSINSIPLIGKSAVNIWDYNNGYMNGTDPYFSPFAKLASGIRGLKDDKSENNERAIFNLMEGGALLAPFPATALKRIYNAGKALGNDGITSAMARLVGIPQQKKKKKIRRLVY